MKAKRRDNIMNRIEIKKFAEELKIPYLVHFTHISNLESIVQRGLLSRKKVDALAEDFLTNDEARYDGRTHTISLSVAHPNDRMFYKYRDEHEDWCVIVLKSSVLWKLNCLFLKYNAADARMSNLDDGQLSTIEAFRSMYEEMDDLPSRNEQCLMAYDPTDKQAEILINEDIPAEYILGVIVGSRQVKKNHSEMLAGYQVKVHSPDKGFYASRLYRRKWQ